MVFAAKSFNVASQFEVSPVSDSPSGYQHSIWALYPFFKFNLLPKNAICDGDHQQFSNVWSGYRSSFYPKKFCCGVPVPTFPSC